MSKVARNEQHKIEALRIIDQFISKFGDSQLGIELREQMADGVISAFSISAAVRDLRDELAEDSQEMVEGLIPYLRDF